MTISDPTRKSLGIENVKEAKDTIPDLKVYGDGDTWKLLCKASSETQGWMKSTKVMNVPGGCLVQVTTQQRNVSTYGPTSISALAEAITFVPGVQITNDATRKPVLVQLAIE